MGYTAYKLMKAAEKPSFKDDDGLLMELAERIQCLFESDEFDDCFMLVDEEDLEEMEEMLEEYIDDEEGEAPFREEDLSRARKALAQMRKDLDENGEAIYIFEGDEE